MSDSQIHSLNPTPGTRTLARRSGVLLSLLVLLLAGGVVAGALWYAGGTDALTQLRDAAGSLISGTPGFFGSQEPVAAASATTPTTTPTATPSLPPEAQQRMFAEQAESREALSALVGGKIAAFETGVAQQAGNSATVPITARFKDGSQLSAAVLLKRYGQSWYFFNLGRPETEGTAKEVGPTAFDSGVVATITDQQAQPATQEMLTAGLLDGGYRLVKVDGVTLGPRTATVDVTLSEGTGPESKGRFVCISKTDGATKYWFVARFEKR